MSSTALATTGDTSRLAGAEKAAILLVALGAKRASAVLSHLEEQDVEFLSARMASIWSVEPGIRDAVFDEVAERLVHSQSLTMGGVGYARQVLVDMFGEARADEMLGGLSQSDGFRPFDFLRGTPPDQICTFLKDEAPQTIALVLSSIYSGTAGRVLSELPMELRTEVSRRIALMGETNPDVIRDVHQGLLSKLSAISTQEFASPGGVDSLAEMLNSAGRSAERAVIEGLATSDPELADEVRMRMFTFEDVVELEDRDIQLILREVDQKDLVLALRGVPEALSEKILGNLSQRGAEMLRDDLEVSPPQRRAVVEEAQGKIVAVVRRLEEAGTIVLRSSGGDAEDELL